LERRAYRSPNGPSGWTAAAFDWHIFSPLGRLGLLIPSRWRRLHRKLCVVDGQVAFCGGINVLDDYVDPNHGELDAPRLDFAVRVTGPLVQDAHAAMAQFWWRLQAFRGAEPASFRQPGAALQDSAPCIGKRTVRPAASAPRQRRSARRAGVA
jgi:cardiolipin synthase